MKKMTTFIVVTGFVYRKRECFLKVDLIPCSTLLGMLPADNIIVGLSKY